MYHEIRLSAAGRELLADLRSEAEEHGRRFFAPLTAPDELLAKLAANVDAAERVAGR